jgi:hypothetical protein
MTKPLIVRRTPEIYVPALTVGLAGKFKIEAVRPNGTKRLLADWFPNIITNIGLDRLGTDGDFLNNCRVGTGTATPVVGDTNLQSQIASTTTIISSSNTNAGSPPYRSIGNRTYQFGAGVAAGNLAEVGIGWASSGSTLFSRALILDGGGNPTTITVLPDEFLNVSYQLSQYAPAADRLGTFGIGSTTYDYTGRAAVVTTWNSITTEINFESFNAVRGYAGAIGSVTAIPSGTEFFPTSTFATYNAGDYYRDVSAVFEPAEGIGVHLSYKLGAGGRGTFQFEIDPTINKTSLDRLTMNFRVGWQRIVGTG